MNRLTRRARVASVALLLAVNVTACSGGQESPSPVPSSATAAPSARPMTPTPGDAQVSAGQLIGRGCSALPADGPGSLTDLGDEAASEAVDRVPQLSRLSVAILVAGLEQTLDSQEGITVFAPTDTAFRSLGVTRYRRLMADPSRIDKLLRYHVVPTRLTPEQLVGQHKTLTGVSLEVSRSGEDYLVDGRATVVCGNVQTTDATFYLIDGVLQP